MKKPSLLQISAIVESGVDLSSGIIRTVAGNGMRGKPMDNRSALEQPLIGPRAAVMDQSGNLFILERNGHALRVVRPNGKIYTLAGTGKKGIKTVRG